MGLPPPLFSAGDPRNDVLGRFARDRKQSASVAAGSPGQQPSAGEPARQNRIQLRCIADINAEKVNWLWPGRIARGKLTVIAGHPGIGKSQLALTLAAIVSVGGTWPVDGTLAPQGESIVLSAEDDAADTIRPRLEAAHAELRAIHLLEMARTVGQPSEQKSFSLVEDIALLDRILTEHPQVALVIVDPLSAYLGPTDSHRNADVRAVLAPLAEVAAKRRVAVVAISHLNKSADAHALLRVTGSLAFVAAARAVFLVAEDNHDPERKLLLPLKNNISGLRTGYAFGLEPVQLPNGVESCRLKWDSTLVTTTAAEAMAPIAHAGDTSAAIVAEAFLAEELADGPRTATALKEAAAEAGIAWRTIQRAQKAAGVKARKSGYSGGWEWALESKSAKSPEERQPESLASFGPDGALRSTTGQE